jgi:hypothetical protein
MAVALRITLEDFLINARLHWKFPQEKVFVEILRGGGCDFMVATLHLGK